MLVAAKEAVVAWGASLMKATGSCPLCVLSCFTRVKYGTVYGAELNPYMVR
jgi:hypothetical protein